ncbi:MAG: hypothetical protein V7727_21595, partial [Sneathiella sp.]
AVLATSEDMYSFCIRGELRDNVDGLFPVKRRNHDRLGEPAHFREKKRQWLCIDFDKASIGSLQDIYEDTESAVEDLIYRHLPKEFQDITCVWQLSTGAGTTDPEGTLSLHFWFWLDRPMGKEELDTFHQQHAPNVDRAIFRTVQPIYTAAPIFVSPYTDPLPQRIGIMEREREVVCLPEQKIIAVPKNDRRAFGTGVVGRSKGYASKIALMGDGEGLDGFNIVIPAAIASLVSNKHPSEINAFAIKSDIRAAIDHAPKGVHRDQSDINRYKSDQYLDECIRTASEKYGLVPVTPLYSVPEHSVSEVRELFAAGLQNFVNIEVARLAA